MKIKQILYLMSFCLLLSATTFAQQVQEFTISGTVVDKDKLSMPGVSVYIKDKPSKGTTTDNDGNFKLKVVYGDKMIFYRLQAVGACGHRAQNRFNDHTA